jgi:hypothetical protein
MAAEETHAAHQTVSSLDTDFIEQAVNWNERRSEHDREVSES